MYASLSHISHSLTNLLAAQQAIHFRALHSGVGHIVSVYMSMCVPYNFFSPFSGKLLFFLFFEKLSDEKIFKTSFPIEKKLYSFSLSDVPSLEKGFGLQKPFFAIFSKNTILQCFREVFLLTFFFCFVLFLHLTGVFSLEWKTLGHILCAISLNQIAVSLSFSPTGQYLAVGYSFTYSENLKMADVIAVQREINTWRDARKFSKNAAVATSLIDISSSQRTSVLTTVNCIKWIPVPGQGLVFGNSIGELKFVVQVIMFSGWRRRTYTISYIPW